MGTHNILHVKRKSKRYPYFVSGPGTVINTYKTYKLKLPLSQTYFHGSKGI